METALLVIATLSALMQGIQTWLQVRDALKTQVAVYQVYNDALKDPVVQERAASLIKFVPQSTIDRVYQRLKKCYEKLNDMLDNEGSKYFPDEITNAAEGSLKQCVCDSLFILRNVLGGLPDPEFENAWIKYACDSRIRKKSEQ